MNQKVLIVNIIQLDNSGVKNTQSNSSKSYFLSRHFLILHVNVASCHQQIMFATLSVK